MFAKRFHRKVTGLLGYGSGHPGNERRVKDLYDADVVEKDRLRKKSVEFAAAHLKVLEHVRNPERSEYLFNKDRDYDPDRVAEFIFDCSAFGWSQTIDVLDENLRNISSQTPILLKEHLFYRIEWGFSDQLSDSLEDSEVIVLTACFYRFLSHVFSDDREVFSRVLESLRSELADRSGFLQTPVEYVVSEAAKIANNSEWGKYLSKFNVDLYRGTVRQGNGGLQDAVDQNFLSIFHGWGLLYFSDGDARFGADERLWDWHDIASKEEAADDVESPHRFPTIPAWWAEVYEKEYLAE